MVLHNLPFCPNQPLKSADNKYTGILKNKINMQKVLDEL
jgi:hypothetical protein